MRSSEKTVNCEPTTVNGSFTSLYPVQKLFSETRYYVFIRCSQSNSRVVTVSSSR